MKSTAEEEIANHPDECRNNVSKLTAYRFIYIRFFLKKNSEKHNATGIKREHNIPYDRKHCFIHKKPLYKYKKVLKIFLN
jgi:uncharacterized protein (DUF1919 family)